MVTKKGSMRLVGEWMCGWNGRMDGMDGWADGRMDGMDGMDEWKNRRMDDLAQSPTIIEYICVVGACLFGHVAEAQLVQLSIALAEVAMA